MLCVEYAYCSNRGKCDFSTGICKCNPDFTGPACSNHTLSYYIGANALPVLDININSRDYQSDALVLKSEKSKAPDFYFLQTLADEKDVFSIRGDGVTYISDLLIKSGGQVIDGAGLFVNTSSGLTVLDDGMSVASDATATPVVQVTSRNDAALTADYSVYEIE